MHREENYQRLFLPARETCLNSGQLMGEMSFLFKQNRTFLAWTTFRAKLGLGKTDGCSGFGFKRVNLDRVASRTNGATHAQTRPPRAG